MADKRDYGNFSLLTRNLNSFKNKVSCWESTETRLAISVPCTGRPGDPRGEPPCAGPRPAGRRVPGRVPFVGTTGQALTSLKSRSRGRPYTVFHHGSNFDAESQGFCVLTVMSSGTLP